MRVRARRRGRRIAGALVPFTPTHALAIVPVARLLPFSALAIGSVIPDLPLYYRVGPSYALTHSFPGVLTACLPLGLIAYALFHALIRHPLLALLPDDARARLATVARTPVSRRPSDLAAVAAAIALGALSHIVWDAFTHAGRWGVMAIAPLSATVTLGGAEIAGYQLLQHGSTLIGLPLLAFLASRWLAKQTPGPVVDGMSDASRLSIALLLVLVPVAVGLVSLTRLNAPALDLALFRFVTRTGGAFVVLLLIYGVAYTLLARASRFVRLGREKR